MRIKREYLSIVSFIILFAAIVLFTDPSLAASKKRKVTKGTAWVTAYYPPERSAYKDAIGRRCNLTTAASNKLPIGTKIWVKGAGYRVVTDRGAKSNDGIARNKGAELWIDLWYPHGGMWSTKVTQYKIVGKVNLKKKKK